MRRRLGFSLVELVVMVLILGILSAVAVGAYLRTTERSLEVSTSQVVRQVRDKIDLHFAEYGTYPANIDPGWLQSGRVQNPYWPDHPNPVWIGSDPDKLYPIHKTLKPTSLSTLWYNQANGAFFARVRQQSTGPASLELFNRVNQSSLNSLGQTD